MLTQEYLKSRVHYNPETGNFTWITNHKNAKSGAIAGYLNSGYRCIGINGKYYKSHRLAFLYMTGSIPEFCDHINRIKHDNRWSNLRPATKSKNCANKKIQINNSSGYPGVSWDKESKKWSASIRKNNKLTRLGRFHCKHEAYATYVLKSRELFGEFSPV